MDIKQVVVEKMKDVFGSDQRRINHALKVLKFSEEIMQGENLTGDIKQIIIMTAILHDIGIHEAERKYNSNSGKYQELEGPPVARRIMESIGVEEGNVERVCYIIGGHHTASKNDGIDFQVIWEADLLVNIEEDGLDKNNPNLESIIRKNFKTAVGRKIAEELYLQC